MPESKFRFEFQSMHLIIGSMCLFFFRRYSTDPEAGARELAGFLSDDKGFIGIHPGDLYGVLIDHFGRQEKYKQVRID